MPNHNDTNPADSHSDSHATGREPSTQKRAYSACLACQRRKKRCDGVRPNCGLCVSLSSPCVYTERKGRGPGKSKAHLQRLEERLKRVESSITTGSNSSKAPSHDTEQNTHTNDAAVTTANPNTSAQTPLDQAHHIDEAIADTLIAPGNPFESRFVTFVKQFSNTRAAHQHLKDISSHLPFPRTVFTPLVPRSNANRLIRTVWSDLPLHSLLFTSDAMYCLLDEQYDAGVDKLGDDVCRWAIINAAIASIMPYKATNEYLSTMAPLAWNFFKNAFAVFAEIATQGSDVQACEALLSMALFSRCSADAKTTSQLVSAATRLILSLGLDDPSSYASDEAASVERERRVFWVAFMLDAEMVHKYGLTPTLGNSVVPLGEFPQLCQQKEMDYLGAMASLASMQLRAHDVLHSPRTVLFGVDLVQAIMSMNQERYEWKANLPRTFQLDKETAVPDSDASRVGLLHLTHHSTCIKINMIIARLRRASVSQRAQLLPLRADLTDAGIDVPWRICVSTAHEVISMVYRLSVECFTSLWELLCHPLAASLLLLCVVLEEPASPRAQGHVDMIGKFVQFLERAQAADNDVRVLLSICSKIHKITTWAVEAQWESHQGISGVDTASREGVKMQLVILQERLSAVDDWLHLAEGLCSNMPVLRARAEEMLGVVLDGEESMDGVYGVCVPDIMKASYQNFTFGP